MTANNKRLIGLVVVIVIVLFGFNIFNSSKFRVTGTTPDHTNYPSSLSVMDIYFNRDLNKTDIESRLSDDVGRVVGLDFDSKVSVAVSKTHLRLTFSQTPLAGSHMITLKQISAVGGSTLDINLPFVVKDISYENLSKAEKALYNKAISEGTDGDFDKYPVLAKLPYETEKYQIIYSLADDAAYPTLTITMRFFEPGNNAIPATAAEKQAYLAEIRKYRTEALDWLRSQGASLNDYALQYSEVDLQDEFPKGKTP